MLTMGLRDYSDMPKGEGKEESQKNRVMEESQKNTFLEQIESACLLFFTFEMVLKIYASGFYSSSELNTKGGKAYTASWSNCFDGMLVVLGWFGEMIPEFLNYSIFRLFRLLRVLRLASHNRSMKLTLQSLFQASLQTSDANNKVVVSVAFVVLACCVRRYRPLSPQRQSVFNCPS